jgi:hypothetical protein
MAVMLGLPVLVALEEGVEEGAFSRDVWGSQVHGTVLNSPGKASVQWLELVHRGWIARKHSQESRPNDHGFHQD